MPRGGTLVSSPFFGSLGWGETISGSSSSASFTGGGQIGYNQQINNWVLGFESDIQYLGASTSAANSFTATVAINNAFSAKTPWFGTTRVRVGTTVSPNFLLYVTGGFAYGTEKLSGLITAAAGGPETFPFGATDTVLGYAVGGGGEWAFDRHWSIKAEYLFVQLGRASQQVPTAAPLTGSDLATDAMTLSVNHDNISIARAGLNYRS